MVLTWRWCSGPGARVRSDADLLHLEMTQRPAFVRGAFMGERFVRWDQIVGREVFGLKQRVRDNPVR